MGTRGGNASAIGCNIKNKYEGAPHVIEGPEFLPLLHDAYIAVIGSFFHHKAHSFCEISLFLLLYMNSLLTHVSGTDFISMNVIYKNISQAYAVVFSAALLTSVTMVGMQDDGPWQEVQRKQKRPGAAQNPEAGAHDNNNNNNSASSVYRSKECAWAGAVSDWSNGEKMNPVAAALTIQRDDYDAIKKSSDPYDMKLAEALARFQANQQEQQAWAVHYAHEIAIAASNLKLCSDQQKKQYLQAILKNREGTAQDNGHGHVVVTSK